MGKNLERLLVHLRKTFLILLNEVRSRHPLVFPKKFLHYLPGVYQPLRWFPGIFILWASCPFHKVAEFFKLFIYSSNLSLIGDYLTLYNFSNLPFHVAFDVFGFPRRFFSVRSIGDLIWFKHWYVKDWVDFPAWRDIEFESSVSSFFEDFEWSI